MEAVHINTGPHALLSEEPSRDAATPLQLAQSSGDPAARQRAASIAGITPGPAATKSAYAQTQSHCQSRHLPSSSLHPAPAPSPSPIPSPSPTTTAATTNATATALFPFASHSSPANSTGPHHISPAPLLPPPPRPPSPPSSAALPGKESRPRSAVSATATSSLSPLLFGPSPRTTPETSLVGASGEYITAVDDDTVAHRTSALRELNSSFPSPVFRHRHTKSAGAQSTTFSQPVIVRTYTGPSHSPSSSSHYRRPSSSHRTGSRAAASHRIPLVPNARAAVSFSLPRTPAANRSENAPGARGWGLTSSLFGMARPRASKGSFFAWPWTSSSDSASAPDETKLPPLEAFTFQGFMADLQTTTDIRADLDRIAEICARSRYSLSNQYEAHMAPHGSGAGFAPPSAGQSRPKGQRKGASSPGGPTLQAVPSDDDEGPSRGPRRRRGGIGSGRRRSTAYGTLETIMSSSRSSEEDKTKKKPAAEIADGVRGRSARKTTQAEADTTSGDTGSSGLERTSRKGKGKPGKEPVHEPDAAGSDSRDTGRADRRPRSTTFAHAVMDSSRHKPPRASVPTNPSAAPALLGEPALPYTTDGSADVYSASGSVSMQGVARGGPRAQTSAPSHRRDVSLARGSAHIADADEEGVAGTPQSPSMPASELAEAGFLSGLTHWIPWTAGPASVAGPSHAEGRLRELLKHVDASSTQDKGKAVGVDG